MIHETAQQKSDRLYEDTYRVNRGLDPIVWDNQHGGWCYAEWMGHRTPIPELNVVTRALLDRKIITPTQLDLLAHRRYLNRYVFHVDTRLHRRKLIEELGRLGFDATTVEAIREVYRELY